MALRALQGPTGGGAPVGGSGTANTIPRWTGASTLGDSVITQSGTFIGINTTNPLAQFTLGGVANSTTKMGFQAAATEVGSITMNSATGEQRITAGFAAWGGFQSFYTNGFERARIDSSGNVGIGTASPGSIVDVLRTANGTTNLQVRNLSATSAAQARLDVVSDAGTFVAGIVSSAWASFGMSNGDAYLWNLANRSLCFGTNSTERARIDSAGNFGLGVTPSAWASSVRAEEMRTHARWNYNSGSDSVAYWTVNAFLNSAGNAIYKATAAASQYTQIGGAHVWERAVSGTAGNTVTWLESARIDSSGNFGIGTGAATTTSAATGSLVIGQNNVSQQWAARIYGGNDANRAPVLSLFRAGNTEGIIAEIKNGAIGALALGITGGVANFNDATLSAACQVQITSTLMDISNTSGYGLKLPNAPNNGDPNTLDSYREGTRVLSAGDLSGWTYVTATQYWTLVGRTVTLHTVFTGGTSSATGGATIATPPLLTPLRIAAGAAVNSSGTALGNGVCVVTATSSTTGTVITSNAISSSAVDKVITVTYETAGL